MTSPVTICNQALARIGVGAIASLDEASAAGRACAAAYQPQRDALLRAHPWGFAKRRVALATAAHAAPGWAFAYQWPADCLALISVGPADRSVAPAPYEVLAGDDAHARIIVSDQPGAIGAYTARVELAVRFDPLFVDALAWRIAFDLAGVLTGKEATARFCWAAYEKAIAAAQAADANEVRAAPPPDAAWISGRW